MLQHLPSREAVLAYLAEFARVLAERGEAFVQLPVLDDGLATARLAGRTLGRRPAHGARPDAAAGVPRRPPDASRARRGLARAGLRVVATDVGPDAPYRFSHDLFLRLTR